MIKVDFSILKKYRHSIIDSTDILVKCDIQTLKYIQRTEGN